MTRDEIRAVVDRLIIEDFEVDRSRLHPTAELRDGLGLDSLDGVDLVILLEKAFNCRIVESEARNIKTLGDVYDRIYTRLGSPDGGAT